MLIPGFSLSQPSKLKLLVKVLDSKENKKVKPFEEVSFADSTALFAFIVDELEYYRSMGHLAVHIDSLTCSKNGFAMYVKLGPVFTWVNLSLRDFPDEDLRLLNLKLEKQIKKPVSLKGFLRTQKKVVSWYENHGYPFAKISLDSFKIENNSLSATWVLSRGEAISIDTINIKGDAKINPNYVYRQIGIFPHSLYHEKRIRDIERVFDQIAFIDEIKPSEVEFFDQSADLFLYLKKKKANRFSGILGVMPNNEKSGKLLLTGEIDFQLLNPFGRGESVQFLWKKTESSSQKLNLNFSYPFLFNTPIGVDYSLLLDKRDSSFLNVENEIGLNYFLGMSNFVKAFYRSKSSSTLRTNIISSEFADVKADLFGIGFRFRKLDYVLNPRNGFQFESQFAYGKKHLKNRNPNNSDNTNKDMPTQFEGEIYMAFYAPIISNFVALLSNRSAFIDNSVLFENELLKIGGHNSLRGFDEESILASAYSLFTMELRYLFEKNSNVFLFVERAWYKKKTISTDLEDKPLGFGIGSSFQTKGGVFTLSYALGKQFDNPVELKNAKIHFGLINYF
ncbi:MAG: hypothetical protein K9H64_07400 [Bacteroidales bacterium]|nr:hypothetical protein [Bacteroidales bacterium]MCF8455633.1 hypothetical protein [Bacteroidales bacterium]